ncbi:ATP-dependent_RNA helicase [Hexamita inflata]|uniref:ATP-dependent RNA helicase n=1 Tax=Hexamita inflata TaxID=28002 RepID=A0AA86NV18_9EUKA|nr:ATP-dependent RNA helicase [Hexamita inflata]CAI9944077.1 ATP-dependent RNA helicase [Hexamita inflata]CAI9958935.1 ATP-dependent RNA helicase [Hexamita inflata]
MELVIKGKDDRPKPNEKKQTAKAAQRLWQTKSTIVFKREDFIATDQLGIQKQDQIAQIAKKFVNTEQQEVLTQTTIAELNLNQHLAFKLEKHLNFHHLTPIQHLSFKPISLNQDVFIKSATGSGKTLAFLIPIMNQILQQKISRTDLRLLIISPTRELSAQTEQLVHLICNSTQLVALSLSGGISKDSEKASLRKGVNIICATPGRMLDHIKTTQSFPPLLEKLQYLVLDECDSLLAQNFTATFAQLTELIPKSVQKVFVSATISTQVQAFAQKFLRSPTLVQTKDLVLNAFRLPVNLRQRFVVSNPKTRLAVLIGLLAMHKQKRCLIFVESKAVCNFLNDILQRILKNFDIIGQIHVLHGGIQAEFRTKVHQEFLEQGGILITTDVAARGLNLGSVDCKNKDEDLLSGVDVVVQYEAPSSIEQYVHRAGRAGRIGQAGENYLFVLPNEIQLITMIVEQTGQNIEYLASDAIGMNVLDVKNPIRLFEKLQAFVEEQVKEDQDLKEMAINAYQGYISGYRAKDQVVKSCFDFSLLHLGHVAKSYGLNDAPSKLNSMTKRGRQQADVTREWKNSSEKTKSLERNKKEFKRGK